MLPISKILEINPGIKLNGIPPTFLVPFSDDLRIGRISVTSEGITEYIPFSEIGKKCYLSPRKWVNPAPKEDTNDGRVEAKLKAFADILKGVLLELSEAEGSVSRSLEEIAENIRIRREIHKKNKDKKNPVPPHMASYLIKKVEAQLDQLRDRRGQLLVPFAERIKEWQHVAANLQSLDQGLKGFSLEVGIGYTELKAHVQKIETFFSTFVKKNPGHAFNKFLRVQKRLNETFWDLYKGQDKETLEDSLRADIKKFLKLYANETKKLVAEQSPELVNEMENFKKEMEKIDLASKTCSELAAKFLNKEIDKFKKECESSPSLGKFLKNHFHEIIGMYQFANSWNLNIQEYLSRVETYFCAKRRRPLPFQVLQLQAYLRSPEVTTIFDGYITPPKKWDNMSVIFYEQDNTSKLRMDCRYFVQETPNYKVLVTLDGGRDVLPSSAREETLHHISTFFTHIFSTSRPSTVLSLHDICDSLLEAFEIGYLSLLQHSKEALGKINLNAIHFNCSLEVPVFHIEESALQNHLINISSGEGKTYLIQMSFPNEFKVRELSGELNPYANHLVNWKNFHIENIQMPTNEEPYFIFTISEELHHILEKALGRLTISDLNECLDKKADASSENNPVALEALKKEFRENFLKELVTSAIEEGKSIEEIEAAALDNCSKHPLLSINHEVEKHSSAFTSSTPVIVGFKSQGLGKLQKN